ncbi:MAG TPA: FtsH protease activity modulator HflK [Alphaproteobacteria bacterium]|nr:FtsH protease activity modulator HflK [Alphaproteobacteria bacterium]HOO51146.1 FtsH protease activity modulator HflK [Alphaproteobacteria bacterium]
MPWNDDSDDHRDDSQNQDSSKKSTKNPWGAPQGDNRPHGHHQRPDWGRGGRNDDEINFEQMLHKIRQSFGGMLPPSQGGHNGGFGKIIFGGLALLLVIWALTGIYFVQPNQHGVVLTFGEYTRTDEVPGIKWRAPWPFQSVQIVDVTTERRIHIGFSSNDYNSSRSQNTGRHESLMLTGDENIVDINFVVLWRIQDAKDYLYSIRDPEDTIQMVAASTMREIIGQTDIQPALTDARTQIQVDAKALMQKLLDEYRAGVTINNVQLQKVDPPVAVVDAFNEVQRARQKKEELKNLAEAYRNDIIPRAKGEAEKLRQDAEAYSQEVVSRATGDAKRFDAVYMAYKSAKDVTAERMYLETMEQVLKNAKTVVLGNENGNVLPFLPLQDGKATSSVPRSSVSSQ